MLFVDAAAFTYRTSMLASLKTARFAFAFPLCLRTLSFALRLGSFVVAPLRLFLGVAPHQIHIGSGALRGSRFGGYNLHLALLREPWPSRPMESRRLMPCRLSCLRQLMVQSWMVQPFLYHQKIHGNKDKTLGATGSEPGKGTEKGSVPTVERWEGEGWQGRESSDSTYGCRCNLPDI